MKRPMLLSTAIVATLASQAFSGTMGAVQSAKKWPWFASISAGPVWAKAGKTQSFYLAPEIEKTYAARNNTHSLASGELFIGLQQSFTPQFLGQVGIALANTSNTKLQGEIWDDADPQFNNHSYQYKIKNSRIALKGKFFLDKGYWLKPWVSGSLGAGFNRSHHFSNTPLIFEAIRNANFRSHTESTVTYTLGAGLQKSINEHWQVGAGYEFADWGRAKMGMAMGQTTNARLTLNHLYTNGVLIHLTYVA